MPGVSLRSVIASEWASLPSAQLSMTHSSMLSYLSKRRSDYSAPKWLKCKLLYPRTSTLLERWLTWWSTSITPSVVMPAIWSFLTNARLRCTRAGANGAAIAPTERSNSISVDQMNQSRWLFSSKLPASVQAAQPQASSSIPKPTIRSARSLLRASQLKLSALPTTLSSTSLMTAPYLATIPPRSSTSSSSNTHSCQVLLSHLPPFSSTSMATCWAWMLPSFKLLMEKSYKASLWMLLRRTKRWRRVKMSSLIRKKNLRSVALPKHNNEFHKLR